MLVCKESIFPLDASVTAQIIGCTKNRSPLLTLLSVGVNMSSNKLKYFVKLNRSRIFVFAFVAIMVFTLVWSVTQNILRRPETEAAAAAAQAGQKLLAKGRNNVPFETENSLKALQIITVKGVVTLSIEVMKTPEQQAQGLMFRQSMPDDQGMLFDFGIERPISMWMKNTYMSLDMVFVTSDGRIHRVEENTEPLSEKMIFSGVSIRAVLELKAGTARRLGIKQGDKLVHSIFLKS